MEREEIGARRGRGGRGGGGGGGEGGWRGRVNGVRAAVHARA